MFAIDRAQFEADREFQELVDAVETRSLRSLDLTKRLSRSWFRVRSV
jgi:hypothetical protein